MTLQENKRCNEKTSKSTSGILIVSFVWPRAHRPLHRKVQAPSKQNKNMFLSGTQNKRVIAHKNKCMWNKKRKKAIFERNMRASNRAEC